MQRVDSIKELKEKILQGSDVKEKQRLADFTD